MADPLRSFIEQAQHNARGYGLMTYPAPGPQEAEEVRAFSRLFHLLDGDLVIRHPSIDLRIVINRLVGPRLAYLLCIGDYELTDLELVQAHVRKEDRVLELGGGLGITTALAAKHSEHAVVVVEPDLRLHELITKQVALNGGHVMLEHGAVVAHTPPSVLEFHVAEEVWFSSLVPGNREQPTTRVPVPALAFADLLVRHKPSVVMMDIEGSERELFKQPLAHAPRLMMVEVHVPQYGSREACAVLQELIDQGYKLVDVKAWTFVLEKKT